MKTIKEVLLDKLLYVGDKIPESLVNDQRTKFILLGTPQQLIDEVVQKQTKEEK